MGRVITLFGIFICVPLALAWARPGATGSHGLLAGDRAGGMRSLLKAYPEALCSGSDNLIVWCDDTTMIWDDGLAKTHSEKLVRPDLEDQMSLRYKIKVGGAPAPDDEPGRIRYEPFLRKMYGLSATEVEGNLVPVVWQVASVKKTLRVTSINRVAEKLKAVIEDVRKLPLAQRRIVAKPAGGFVWRQIAGTKRLSAHSFGIAVDVGLKHADYWRWVKPGPNGLLPYRNRIPLAVVRAFEKQGFIWGGRWYRFDTMHFEYRPELFE